MESGGFRERLAWAAAGGLMITLHNVGADYQAGKLTRAVLVFRITSAPVLIFLAAIIAKQMGFNGEMNGMVSIVLFLIGRDGLTYLARAVLAKWLGVATEPERTTVFAATNTTVKVPEAHNPVDVKTVGYATPQSVSEYAVKALGDMPPAPLKGEDYAILSRLKDKE